jgi:hypothetical protein
VITAEQQYRSAKSEAEKFERAIAAARDRELNRGVHRRVHEATIDAPESELAILREQLEHYDRLKAR